MSTFQRGTDLEWDDVRKGLPCSPAEEAIWLADQHASPGAYNLPLILRCSNSLDLSRLRIAMRALERRHEALGCAFPSLDGRPVRTSCEVRLEDFEVVEVPSDLLQDAQHAFAAAPFDIYAGPLIRTQVFRVADAFVDIVIVVHHMIADAQSLNILSVDIQRLYHTPDGIPPAPSIGAFVTEWTRSLASPQAIEEARRYAERLQTPPDHVVFEPPSETVNNPLVRRWESYRAIPGDWMQAANKRRITPFMLACAAFIAALRQQSLVEMVTVAVPFSLRGQFGSHREMVGNMVNTVLVPVSLRHAENFSDVVEIFSESWKKSLRSAAIPSACLKLPVSVHRHNSPSKNFQFFFGWQKYSSTPARDDDDVFQGRQRLDRLAAICDMSFEIVETDQSRTTITCEFDALRISHLTADRLVDTVIDILQKEEAEAAIELFPSLPPPAAPRPEEREDAVSRFLRSAAATPDAPAVETLGTSRSYRALLGAAMSICTALSAERVAPGDIVVIEERNDGFDTLVATIIGAWISRISVAILPENAGRGEREAINRLPRAGFVSIKGTELHWHRGTGGDEAVTYPVLWDATVPGNLAKGNGILGGDLAYLVTTSGSTSVSKIVAVCHGALATTLAGWEGVFGIAGLRQRHIQAARPNFDVFFGNLVRALCFSGTLVHCNIRTVRSGLALSDFLRSHRIGFIETVPQVVRSLMVGWRDGDAVPDLSIAIVGSDVWRDEEFVELRRHLGPICRLFNTYGVSEAAIDSLCFEYTGQPVVAGRSSLGKPLRSVTALIVDTMLRPVGNGETGELLIGGPGVATEYLGDAEANRERFVDMFDDGRFFRTYDFVRRDSAGGIHFEGRNVNQLSISGVRIESENIESVIAGLEGVRAVAVTARDMADGDSSLAVFLVTNDGQDVSEGRVRSLIDEFFSTSLPVSLVTKVEALPYLPNGKIDRRRLSELADALAEQLQEAEPYVPLQNDIEGYIASEIASILGISSPLSRHAHFFHLGGSSLSASTLAYRLHVRYGCKLTFATVRQAPTIFALADTIAVLLECGGGEAAAAQSAAFWTDIQWTSNVQPGPAKSMLPDCILMTGATGKLGSSLLDQAETAAPAVSIFALVRDRGRMKRTHGPSHLVVGSLEKIATEGAAAVFPAMPENTAVLHAGYAVDFVSPYQDLRDVNVVATRRLLEYAANGNLPFHFLSSASIESFATAVDVKGGYNQTKWACEAMCAVAGENGMAVIVYRLPHVVDAWRTTGNPDDDFFWCFVKASLSIGMLPDVATQFDPIRTRMQAQVILDELLNHPSRPGLKILRLSSRTAIDMAGLADVAGRLGRNVSVVPLPEWADKMRAQIDQDPNCPFLPFAELVESDDLIKFVFDATVRRRETEAVDLETVVDGDAKELIGIEMVELRRMGWI